MEFELISEIVKETVTKFLNIDEQINLTSFFQNKKINLKDYSQKIKIQQPIIEKINLQENKKNPSLNVSYNSQSAQSNNQSVNQSLLSNQNKQEALEFKKKKNYETWLSQDGNLILQKALQNLNLDLNKIQRTKFTQTSDSQLQDEKKKVKNELKKFDQAFQNYFGQLPQKNNKELLRPLYIYYNMIKQQISNNTQLACQKIQEKPDNFQQNDKKVKNIEQQVNLNNIVMLNNQKMDKTRLQFTLDDLKLKKQKLRSTLQEYQTEFIKNNNRKIKFNKDLIPIEKEYIRYKEIKLEIQKIELLL